MSRFIICAGCSLADTRIVPFVVVRDGSYRLDDRLTVWTDVEAFEQHMRRAGELEHKQRPLEAIHVVA